MLHQGAPSETTHLTAQEISAYVSDRMDETDVEVADSHLAMCDECMNAVARLKSSRLADHLSVVRRLPLSPAPGNKSGFWSRERGRMLLQGTAAAAIILLAVSTLVLYAGVRRLRAELDELERQNEELRAVLPDLRDLRSQIEDLRKSHMLTPSPELILALNDAGRVIGLNSERKIVGLDTLSPEQETLVKAALLSGRVPAPRGLVDVTTKDDPIMGPSERDSLRLLSPAGTATRNDRPTFRWTALDGASSYRVTVSDSAFRQVATSEPLSGTEWTLPQPLKRGGVYSWEVTAVKDGKEITAPIPPAREVRFKVLDSAKLDELENASRDNADSHLLLGLLYVNAGLLDDGEREFQVLASANPQSPVARKLLNSVKSLRSSKAKTPRR
ncbi:MAG TPA: hypothetical protein VFV34_00040 [Blastocatellia bacterium]|nr:hypothetical protein [Blastocatellia bacterium]